MRSLTANEKKAQLLHSIATVCECLSALSSFSPAPAFKGAKLVIYLCEFSANAASHYYQRSVREILSDGLEELTTLSEGMCIKEAFRTHINQIKQTSQWQSDVVDHYGVQLIFKMVQNWKYDTANRTFTLNASSYADHTPLNLQSDREKAALSNDLTESYHSFMKTINSQPCSANLFVSNDMKSHLVVYGDITEEHVNKLLETLATKINAISSSQSGAQSEQDHICFLSSNLTRDLRDVSCLMQDVAILCAVRNQSSYSQELSNVADGANRLIAGITRFTETDTKTLLAYAVSFSNMVAGIATIVRSAISFYLGINTSALEHISKQMQAFDDRLQNVETAVNAIWENQKTIIQALGVLLKSVSDINERLIRFEKRTGSQLNHLVMQEIHDALFKLNEHIEGKSVPSLMPDDLHRAMQGLVKWLKVTASSEVMNGASYADITAQESIQVLSSPSAANMDLIGYVFKRLQHYGIKTPYLSLPPKQSYLSGIRLCSAIMMSENITSDAHGCSDLVKHIYEKINEIVQFILFITNTDEVWEILLEVYRKNLSIFVGNLDERIRNDNDSLDYYQAQNRYKEIYRSDKTRYEYVMQKVYRGKEECRLAETANTRKREAIENNELYVLEDVRLLMVRLSQWTGRALVRVAELPSRDGLCRTFYRNHTLPSTSAIQSQDFRTSDFSSHAKSIADDLSRAVKQANEFQQSYQKKLLREKQKVAESKAEPESTSYETGLEWGNELALPMIVTALTHRGFSKAAELVAKENSLTLGIQSKLSESEMHGFLQGLSNQVMKAARRLLKTEPDAADWLMEFAVAEIEKSLRAPKQSALQTVGMFKLPALTIELNNALALSCKEAIEFKVAYV